MVIYLLAYSLIGLCVSFGLISFISTPEYRPPVTTLLFAYTTIALLWPVPVLLAARYYREWNWTNAKIDRSGDSSST